MAKKERNRFADYATYVVARMLVCVVQMVTPRVAYVIADFFAWLVYAIVARRRRIALENVQAAFPELATDPVAADRLVRAMFRHFIRAVVELMLLPRKLRPATSDKYIRPDPLLSHHLAQPRGVLIVTAHFGNWEMAGFWFGVAGFRTHAIARVLDNPYLERYVMKFRQATGQTIIAKHGEFDRLTEVLKHGGKVATLVDQDAGPRGTFVDFFGRPASTHRAPAILARRHDALIVVAGVPRVARADDPEAPEAGDGLGPLFYRIEVLDVIDPREYAGRRDAAEAITARYTAALEKLIREHPEQYFWLHRRWKHQPTAKDEDEPVVLRRAA